MTRLQEMSKAYKDLQAKYDDLQRELNTIRGSESTYSTDTQNGASLTSPVWQTITSSATTAVEDTVQESVDINIKALWSMVESGWGA
jgi:hypothetical protein